MLSKAAIGTVNRIFSSLIFFLCLYRSHQYIPSGYGPINFLTLWNISAALLFYAMSLLCHFLPYLRSGREQNLIRDLIYFGIIFPIGTTVFSFFWGLTFLNPTFILSDAVRLPGWANHAMHTWILPAAIIEGICFYHSKPSSSQGRALTVSFLAAYCGFTLVMGLVFNKWPYPFLLKLTIPYRLLFAIIPMSCSLLFYTLGEKLNSLFWKPVKIQTS
ncbi:androgen-dependent TFPI-regulating protein-like [Panonychus citri]|uniref:androgen-dependent TFPI-regulating protein-like n=1 Tax=Panonychus citri TaxID=50023 RepID=UPI002307145C|nr:androgen-dependent TFPI-regulating protein-like [Panonychus citri]